MATKRTLQTGFVLGLLVFAGTARAAPPPAPGAEAEAKAHYSRGVELYNDGAYSAALVELERAQSIAPYFGILHSIGLVKVQLADFVGGIAAFEEYLVAGGDEVPAQRKQEVKERLVQLQDRIGSVEVTVNGEGAEVVLDDTVVGVSPLPKPIKVNPGKHELGVRRTGEKGETKKIAVAGGDKLKVAFDLSGAQVTTNAPSAERPAATGAPKWVVYTWIGAGAFAAGAITTGVIGLSKSSDLKSKRDSEPTDSKALDSLSSDVKTFGIITDVLIVPAVILGSISLYFTLRSPAASDPATAPKASAPPRTTTTVTFGGKSVGLRGTF